MKENKMGYATDFLFPEEEEMGRWWRSEATVLGENPYLGFHFKKDWPLKEAINMHLTILQQESCQRDPRFCHIDNLDIQSGLTNRKIGFTPWQWEEEITVLSLDYFSFPFAILVRQFYTYQKIL